MNVIDVKRFVEIKDENRLVNYNSLQRWRKKTHSNVIKRSHLIMQAWFGRIVKRDSS